MITQLILSIAFSSAWVLGLTIASQEDMILERFQKWGEAKEKQGQSWVKALITCPSCMPSIHSMFGYLFVWIAGYGLSWRFVAMYPIVIFFTCIIVTIVWNVYLWIDVQIQYYSNIERLSHYDIKDRKDEYNRRKNRSLNNQNH
jgi:hypothetical protein